MYIGYIAVRSLPGEARVRGTRSAVVGVLAALMIYPVHMSVTWYSSIHQGATIGRDTQMGGTQLFSLFLGFITFALLASWLVVHRFRVGWLADQLGDIELEDAITARRSEALPGGLT
jgi:heme exporter protein C